MKRKNAIYYFLICLLFLFVMACDISTNSSDDDKITQKELELKLTEVALQVTQTYMAAPDSSEEEQPDASPPDSEEEANNGSEDETSCNSSRMVSESIPDGTNFQAGETFIKSWTLRNAGDCDWTTDYKFVYEAGDQMGGKSSMNVPSVIEPGETVTFNIDMTAPNTDGSYTGVWRLKADDGEKLGKYWASISVGSSLTNGGIELPNLDIDEPIFAILGTVTKVTTSLVDIYIDDCPYKIHEKVIFQTDGYAEIEFEIQRSDLGGLGFLETMTVKDAGTVEIPFEFDIKDHGVKNDIWVLISKPDLQLWGPFEFIGNCQ